MLWTLVGGVTLIVLFLAAATLWLSPERLTALANKELSEEVNADVRFHNLHFTLWSSFPRVCLEADSVSVFSRNFDGIPGNLRALLPGNPDFLLSANRLKGAINIIKLFNRELYISDVNVDSLRLNLVSATPEINNYDIFPTDTTSTPIPYFKVSHLEVGKGGEISYYSVPSNSSAKISLFSSAILDNNHDNDYSMKLKGRVSAVSGNMSLLRDFPFELDGDMHLKFNPFGISTTNYDVKLGSIKGHMSLNMDMENSMHLHNLSYNLQDCTMRDLLSLFPSSSFPVLERINADMDVFATARLISPYDFSSAFFPSFEVDFKAPEGHLAYTLSDRERYELQHVGFNGKFVFNGRMPANSYLLIPFLSACSAGADIKLAAVVRKITSSPEISGIATARINLAEAGKRIKALNRYHLSGNASINARVNLNTDNGNLTYGIPNLEISGRHAGASFGKFSIALANFRINCNDSISSPDHINARLRGDAVELKSPGLLAKVHGVDTKLSLDKKAVAAVIPEYAMPRQWMADSATLSRVSHSPYLLKAETSPSVKKFLKEWDCNLLLDIKSGILLSNAFSTPIKMSGASILANTDSINIRQMSLYTEGTLLRLSGYVSNMKQFLVSQTPSPLRTGIHADFDTIQFNRIARAYSKVHPEHGVSNPGNAIPKTMGNTLSDTTTMLLPRNIEATVSISAMQTRYINLHLYDLAAYVKAANGNLDVSSLQISSDFGHAIAGAAYHTSDINNMNLGLSLGLEGLNVVNFFKNFHTLLLMMPQMRNLSGTLSATCEGNIRIFPNMYLNIPSTRSKIHVRSDSIRLHQNKFIRKIRRMLLIPVRGDLHFSNLDILASVHNNLLEIYPFSFEVSNYKLLMEGLNNFNGDMFYHIAVEKWPLKIPFGLNIHGNFHNPDVTFGGSRWKNVKGTKISAGVMDYNMINMVKEARRYMKKFVRTAAEYSED
ncbi:MAG: hypothetical protein NC204_01075 [Candidatus Amulumruptor caecigallinarius]|nr:hypothetical protein [Candidatus Amulumruptor caecigallinarius]